MQWRHKFRGYLWIRRGIEILQRTIADEGSIPSNSMRAGGWKSSWKRLGVISPGLINQGKWVQFLRSAIAVGRYDYLKIHIKSLIWFDSINCHWWELRTSVINLFVWSSVRLRRLVKVRFLTTWTAIFGLPQLECGACMDTCVSEVRGSSVAKCGSD